MLIGCLYAKNEKSVIHNYTQKSAITSMLILLVTYGILKFIILMPEFSKYQFSIHLVTIPILISLAVNSSSNWVRKFTQIPVIEKTISFLSDHTLEIYLLQAYIYTSPFITNLPFPNNILLFTIVLLLLAYLTRCTHQLIFNKILKI
jgi:hypothetical protein